jgi:hypothetical protein
MHRLYEEEGALTKAKTELIKENLQTFNRRDKLSDKFLTCHFRIDRLQ